MSDEKAQEGRLVEAVSEIIPVSRRRFLFETVPGALIVCGLSPWFSLPVSAEAKPATRELFVVWDTAFPSHLRDPDHAPPAVPGTVRIFEPARGSAQVIPLPFFGHGISMDPRSPHLAFTTEKWGVHGALLDFKAAAATKQFDAPAGRRFFGHSAFSTNGDVVFATMMDDAKYSGFIGVFDPKSGKMISDIPSYGRLPHECRLLPSGDVIAVMNSLTSGNKSSKTGQSLMTWIDIKTGKKLHEVPLGTYRRRFSHFDFAKDGWIVACGLDVTQGAQVTEAQAAVIDDKRRVRYLELPAAEAPRQAGELLSLAIDEARSLVAITCSNANALLVWNYKTGEYVRKVPMHGPKGIAYSSRRGAYVVSEATDGNHLRAVDSGLQHPQDSALGLGGNGSHLYRTEFPA